MLEQVLPVNQRAPIPDSQIPRLDSLASKGKIRPLGISRFEFVRNTEGPLTPDKRFKQITDEEAGLAKKVCGAYLDSALKIAKKDEKPLTLDELSSIYEMATNRYGLSRLEVEELGSHNKDWLIFCLSPQRPFPPPPASLNA